MERMTLLFQFALHNILTIYITAIKTADSPTERNETNVQLEN